MSNRFLIELRAVSKSYGQQEVVRDLTLQVEPGEFLTLLGASGSGKTTTLRMIGGFERPSRGEVLLDGECVNDRPPYARNINTVFQNYALFPHMTVFENVAFGLRMKRLPKPEILKRAADALRMVKLQGLEGRLPRQLSGGQQQRVSLARALVNRPQALLLDEPLGALDLKLRRAMQLELKELQRGLGITFLYVTHDQEEALTMSDRIALLSKGRLVQVGAPEEIYHRPGNRFVADFIGETNLLPGKVVAVERESATVDVEGIFVSAIARSSLRPGDAVELAIRPEVIGLLTREPPRSEMINSMRVVCQERIFVGATTRYRLKIDEPECGPDLILLAISSEPYRLDARPLWAVWDAAATAAFPAGE